VALTKCPECGHDVSTLADKCPNCGAPIAQQPATVVKAGPSVVLVISLIALGAILGAAFGIGGFMFYGKSSPAKGIPVMIQPTPTSAPRAHTITYRVDAPESAANIHYANDRGGTSQENCSELHITNGGGGLTHTCGHWQSTVTMQTGDAATVTAQLESSGSVTCSILMDGETVQSKESSGDYAVAMCGGKVP
jgi:hypothetical protein